jgi:hypothetical protein
LISKPRASKVSSQNLNACRFAKLILEWARLTWFFRFDGGTFPEPVTTSLNSTSRASCHAAQLSDNRLAFHSFNIGVSTAVTDISFTIPQRQSYRDIAS